MLVAVIMLGAAGLYASHRALERMRSFDADERLLEGLQRAAEFHGDHFEASMRTASTLLLLAITLFIAAAGVGCVALLLSGRKDSLLPGLLGAPVCALVVASVVPNLWRALSSKRPWLRMDTGVIDALPYGPIPWTDVVAMRSGAEPRSGRPYLTLVVRQPGRYLRGNLLNTVLAGGPASAEIGELRLPVGLLDVHHATVSEAARQLRARVQPPLLDVWVPGMTARQVEQQLRHEEILRRLAELADPKLIGDATLAESECLVAELSGPSPFAPALEANARRVRRLAWLAAVIGALAIALQVYRILRVL